MKNKLNVILTGTPSDSHMWNLIFLELFLQENSCKVRNLGPCVPIEQIHKAIKQLPPDLIVITSISGHLFQDAIKIITSFSPQNSTQFPPIVVGGKMGISEKTAAFQKKKLIKLGYNEVFIDNNSLGHFKNYLNHLLAFKVKAPLRHAV